MCYMFCIDLIVYNLYIVLCARKSGTPSRGFSNHIYRVMIRLSKTFIRRNFDIRDTFLLLVSTESIVRPFI